MTIIKIYIDISNIDRTGKDFSLANTDVIIVYCSRLHTFTVYYSSLISKMIIYEALCNLRRDFFKQRDIGRYLNDLHSENLLKYIIELLPLNPHFNDASFILKYDYDF